MRNRASIKLVVFLLMSVIFSSGRVTAGGPLLVNSDGSPLTWDNSSDVELHIDAGDCASFSQADMADKLNDNLSAWTDINNIDLDFDINDNEISEDIDIDNYTDLFVDSTDDAGADDGINPVIFDETGEIVVDIFGSGNQFAVLGFAGADNVDNDDALILDGEAVINCLCLSGNANFEDCEEVSVEFSEDDLDFTLVHEIGHFIGFDHTQVNQLTAESVDCDLDEAGDCDDIPTMYPVAVDSADQITPANDDKVIALTLYGNSSWEDSFCTITGALTDADGAELRCADVQAIADDTEDTIAVVSGAFAPAEDSDGDGYTDGSGECLSDCGSFTLRGLDPSKSYTITVKPVDSQWTGGSGIGPCSTQNSDVVEEEIGTSDDCSAGATVELGTVATESTQNQEDDSSDDSSDDGSSDDSSSSSEENECGLDQDFTTCSALYDCRLNPTSQAPHGFSFFLLFSFFVLPLVVLAGRRLF